MSSNWATLRQAVIEDFHLDSSGSADDHVNRAACAALEDLRPMEFPFNQGTFTMDTVADQASYAIATKGGATANLLPWDFFGVLGQELKLDHEKGGNQPVIMLFADVESFRRERWYLNASGTPRRWTFHQDKLWVGPYPPDSVDEVAGDYLKDLETPKPEYISSAWVYRGADGFLIGKEIAQGWQENNDVATYVDLTVAMNSPATADVSPFPAAAGASDAVYFGLGHVFEALSIVISTAGAGTYTVTWEYWDGSAWTAIPGLTDGTTNFQAAPATVTVTFTAPRNWARTTVNSSDSLYFIRAKRDSGTVTTDPVLTSVASTTGIDGFTNAWFTNAFELLEARCAWRYFTTHDRSEKDAAAAMGLYQTALASLMGQRGPKQVTGRIVPFLGGHASFAGFGSRDYYG